MLRKLLRFRLRELLLLVTVVACLAGWYSWAARQRQRELVALKTLEANLGGYIYEAYEEDLVPMCGVGLSGRAEFEWQGPPGMVKSLLVSNENRAFFRLTKLCLHCRWFSDVPIDDETVEQLAAFSELKELELGYSLLSPVVVEQLRQRLPATTIVVGEPPDREADLARRAKQLQEQSE
ncbi:hypothetical protein NG895_00970 [Aeoliella sp. ICT_H6.2]|uniref:Leucine Rich repeats (2 copies) n=1 Tax=Aeoliella straminimaris TaxID=2954799 RepID=A0A9X2F570_9BACT|nr:hypothetical protein [Aeoliella straminimaris]MCO6042467.1 hypothetical protein [Aeoliella straminimaris]